MKRLWFAIIFISICLAICLAEQHYIKDFYNEMNGRIEQAIVYSDNKDERLDSQIKDIKEYWYKHNDLIFTLTNHEVLDDLSAVIRSLDTKHADESLRKAKATLEVFYENQRITLSNIF